MKLKFDIQYFAESNSNMDILNEAEMINYSREVVMPTMLGDELFPDRKTLSLKVGFVEANALAPVVASVHGFDTKTQIGSRDSFETLEFDKMLIKRQLPITEELLEKLANPRTREEYNEIVDTIYNDGYNLMTSVKARTEAMKMELLSKGTVTIDENNVQIVLDYQVPANHKAILSVGWDQPTSTPLADIQQWVDKINEDTGIVPTRALTSTKVLRNLQKNESVQIALYGEVQKGKFVTQAELNSLLESMGLPTIAVYDRVYRKQLDDGTYKTVRYFPENQFTLFPSDRLGEGLYGRTPTELRKVRTGHNDTQYGNIYLTVYDQDDPVVTWTKAEGLFAPSFPAYKEVFMATVLND